MEGGKGRAGREGRGRGERGEGRKVRGGRGGEEKTTAIVCCTMYAVLEPIEKESVYYST